MARTILAIAREAAERDATAPAPAQLFGTNSKIARTLRIGAADTIRDFLRRPEWQGLSEFQSTWVFALHPGRFAYPLPPDFLRMIVNTEHRGGWPMGLCGPADPRTWANWIFGGAAAPVEMGWRIRNGAIFIEPTPQSYELITIEYISRFPVVSDLQAGDYDFTVTPPRCNAPFVPRDGHISIPRELELGFDPANAAEYDSPPGWDVAIFGPEMSEILRTINVTSAIAPLPQVRRPEFTADTDKPAFEDDYLLSIGMTWRLRRSLGMDYAEIAAEYEEELERKVSSDAGGPRAFTIGARRRTEEVSPLGDGRWMVT
jgi:hypothetical protein